MSEPQVPKNNTPEGETQPKPNTKPKRSNAWIYLSIIGLLLGVNIYLYLSREGATEQQIEHAITSEVKKIDSVRWRLQEEYNAALVRLDDLIGKNKQLDRDLRNAQSDLRMAKSRIQEILESDGSSDQELAEARILIRNLNAQLDIYEKQLVQLRRVNRIIAKERDSVVNVNEQMHEELELAKVLHASNIRLNAINLRKGGRKETLTTRAKRVDLLRIKFDIDENLIAESGPKELHLRIIDADQQLLSNIALGSGSFLKEDGTFINYSVSKTIDLEQGAPKNDIVVDWQQSAEYPKGDYLVEIYYKGFLIGKGTSSLR